METGNGKLPKAFANFKQHRFKLLYGSYCYAQTFVSAIVQDSVPFLSFVPSGCFEATFLDGIFLTY